MTEIEKMQRARMYITKLAEGINPLTNEEISEDSFINNVRFARCFFYISDILKEVIDNGGKVGGKHKNGKIEIILSEEIIGKVHISRKPIPISELTKNINVVLEENGSKKIQYKMLTQWLIKNEYLDEITLADGKTKKELTPKSQEIGITSEHRTTQFTSYDVILYSSSAQEFILHNLQVIVNEYEKPTPTPKKAKPSTIEEWTTNEEKQLLLEYSSKLTIAEISTRHNRTPKEIEDRLTLLGKI